MAAPRRATSQEKIGLIMEGGAMRGMFTMGVTDILMENSIHFDGAIGVSAGAGFGCNVKSQQIGRAFRYSKRFARDKRFASVHSLITTGNLYNENFLYHEIPEKLDPFDEKAYKANPMRFYVVATNKETAEPVYKELPNGDAYDLEWIRASASMPGFSKDVIIDGVPYCDGGVTISIPLAYFQNLGYTKNVVVSTQKRSYVKEKYKFAPLLPFIFRKQKALAHAIAERHNAYNQERDYLFAEEKKGTTYVITPPEDLGFRGR